MMKYQSLEGMSGKLKKYAKFVSYVVFLYIALYGFASVRYEYARLILLKKISATINLVAMEVKKMD